MNENDDDLARRIRAADPASAPLDYGSSPHGIQIRDRILAKAAPATEPRRLKQRRIRFVSGWSLAAATALVFVLVATITLLQPRTAYAITPPPLDLASNDATVADVIDGCIAKLDNSASAEEPSRSASYEGWYLQVTIEGDNTVAPVIVPEEQTVEWTADLSGTATTTAGEAYTVQDGNVIPPATDVPAEGDVLQNVTYEEGTMPVVFSDSPPSDLNGMRTYLATVFGIDESSDDTAYIDAIRALLNEWTLTNAQYALLLQLVEQLDGVSVAGDVTDRLGRAGTALRIAPPDGQYYERLLILSQGTGRIIGMESVYIGGSPDIDLPTSSVVEYVAWK